MLIRSGEEENHQNWIDKNKDPYGGAVITYAHRWAELMEERIHTLDNHPLAALVECAEELSHTADEEGITGFMYGAAVQFLSQTWEYGEDLRRWHNKDYGEAGEKANQNGGVINPAIITVG